MNAVKLVIDGAVMQGFLRGPEGPVFRHLIVRGQEFQEAARAQIAHQRKTGCLEDGIVKRIEETPEGPVLVVIADTVPCSPKRVAYSLFVHEGAEEHDIFAQPGKSLGFWWENGPDGPGMYYFASVHHPGTKPNRFFSDNLAIFAR